MFIVIRDYLTGQELMRVDKGGTNLKAIIDEAFILWSNSEACECVEIFEDDFLIVKIGGMSQGCAGLKN